MPGSSVVPSLRNAGPKGPADTAPLWVRNALLDPENEVVAAAWTLGLDRTRGIAPESPEEGRLEACPRWDPNLLLRWQNGLESGYLRGRCKATNLCRYCQRLYVRETVEMLILDALDGPPVCWSVLTAREHLTRPEFNEHLRMVRRLVRAEIPTWEYFCSIEFQPQRRAQVDGDVGGLHANLLHKGVPIESVALLHEVLSAGWCERVDALPRGQWTSPARDGVAVMKYVTGTLAHGLKQEQAPPIGWKGHRSSQSRGYLVRPASVMRREARESLRWRSTLAKVEGECPDLSAVERHTLVTALVEEQAGRWWAPMFGLSAGQAETLVGAGTIWCEGDPHRELREGLC